MDSQISETGFSYRTIKITQSRINKGLLAIPVSLIDKFPKDNTEISVYFDNDNIPQKKQFHPYKKTKSREARILGLASWFKKHAFKDGDEIVVEFLAPDNNTFSLKNEKELINEIKLLQYNIISLIDKEEILPYESEEITEQKEMEIEGKIDILAKKANKSRKEILIAQYLALQNQPIDKRKYTKVNIKQKKEIVPGLYRKILEEIYQGRCQLSDFTFVQKNGKPHFEVHHIDNERGNDFRNILVVSPNIHAQFTYADYEIFFDTEGWLRKVRFENTEYQVKQILDKISKKDFRKEVHY